MRILVTIPTWNPITSEEVLYNLEEYFPLNMNYKWDAIRPRNAYNWGPVESMSQVDMHTAGNIYDVYVFCHDDIQVHEDWVTPLVEAFTHEPVTSIGDINYNPKIGLVGFHGAKQLGSDDIYRTPYKLQQLARFNPLSNMSNAEEHGKRINLPTQVATLDGFFLAFSAEAYHKMGGWQACLDDGIIFHMYDNWAAMRMHELGYETYMLPVSVTHFGGGTEVGMAEQYEKWCRAQGFKDGTELHQKMHERFYERFRGQLPLRIR